MLRLNWEEESCSVMGWASVLPPRCIGRPCRGDTGREVTELNILEHAIVAVGWASPWQKTYFLGYFLVYILFFGFFLIFPLTKGLSGQETNLCSKICVRSWLEKDLFVPSVLLDCQMKIYLLIELEERDSCLREPSSGSFSTLLSKRTTLTKVFQKQLLQSKTLQNGIILK